MIKKKILYVYWGNYPEIRCEKVSKLCSELKYEIDLLCVHNAAEKSSGYFRKILEIEKYLENNLFVRLFNRVKAWLKNDPCEFSWRYLSAFKKIIQDKEYALVIWDGLPGLLEASQIGKSLAIPVVCEMRENHPYNMWSTARDLNSNADLYNLNKWLSYEDKATSLCDAIIVNVEEMGARLAGMHFTQLNKIFTVMHGESTEEWNFDKEEALANRFKDYVVGLYVGGCSVHRGLEIVIRAMPFIRRKIDNFVFVIVGDGNAIPRLKKLIIELRLEDSVFLEGQLPYSQAKKYYKIAQFGFIPHLQYGQTDNTVPHKLAQNMVNGLPSVVSSAHCLQRIIREFEVGVDFAASNCEDLANKVIELIQNQTYYRKLSKSALKYAQEGLISWKQMRMKYKECFEYLKI